MWLHLSKSIKRETEVSTKEIGELLSKANGMKASRKVIAGDFNLKGIDWENDHVIDNHLHLVDFVTVVHDNFLHQHVKKPTGIKVRQYFYRLKVAIGIILYYTFYSFNLSLIILL